MKSMLGTWLEEQRSGLNLTKGQMAKKIGIVIGQYSAYVSGKSMPRKATVEKMSSALRISADELNAMLNVQGAPDISDTHKIESKEAPAAVEALPVPEIPMPPQNLPAQLAAAQNKILEGKLDIVIALLTDISNRLP